MILPNLMPLQMRSGIYYRGAVTYGNSKISNTQFQFQKSQIPAKAGDLVVINTIASGTNLNLPTTNFGMVFNNAYNGYVKWTGNEPDLLTSTVSGATLSAVTTVIYVFTGVTKQVQSNLSTDSNSAVLTLTSPARLWISVSRSLSTNAAVATPPTGYTGYAIATSSSGDSLSVRACYRIANENSQLAGSWQSLPSQHSRFSVSFR